MWRIIQRFADEDVTIDENKNVRPKKIQGIQNLIFKEHQLKYCKCTDLKGEKQEYWCGQAEFECSRGLEEITDQRRLHSQTFLCKQSGYHITILKNTPSENLKHTNEYMGNLEIFKD